MTALATYEVPVTRALEDSDVKRTTVWRFDSSVVDR
jgi:predicted nicotinamide N-methyase